MNTNNLIQCLFYLLAMLAVTKPLGWYIAKVYEGEAPWLGRVLGGFEKLLYRLCGVDSKEEMNWKTYAKALMVFSTVSVLALSGFSSIPLFRFPTTFVVPEEHPTCCLRSSCPTRVV